MFFRIPPFLRPHRPFNRLRSFHLTPAEASAQLELSKPQFPMGGTNSQSVTRSTTSFVEEDISKQPQPSNISVPLPGSTIVLLALVASIFFVLSISLAFIGANVEEPNFKLMLNSISQTNPGIVLIGESVDVDVDEPSLTVRWSILSCGTGTFLPGSEGAHGSNLCGLPTKALQIFVDNAKDPAVIYDPTQIPYNKDTGHRRSIQNLFQFDSDHVLDVQKARLYPFDTYILSSTLRAVSSNQTLYISKATTIDTTSSFDIETVDMESYSTLANGESLISRDIDVHVGRPSAARTYTLLLFGLNWTLTHVTLAHVLLARRLTGMKNLLKHLVSCGAILVAIPQIRNSMPDAPGLDGVLIDAIGFFPQVIISGVSAVILLLFLIGRECDFVRLHDIIPVFRPQTLQRPVSTSVSTYNRPPPPPTANSTSMEIAQYELHRLLKHLKGQYVFPPVQPSHRLQPSSLSKPSHRRVKTMSRVMEAGEVSHWSDDD